MRRKDQLKVSGSIRLDTAGGVLGNPRWLALLESLGQSRSITAAARQAGLSYKAAWDAIDAMNNLSGKPVVATTVGGRGGGGAALTPTGMRLLETYRNVSAENEKFLDSINARLTRARQDLRVLGRFASLRTSARNQWVGKVARLRRGAVNDEVELRLAGGDSVVAVVTHESVAGLDLRRGVESFALVKASSVIVARGHARLPLSARNQLRGTIARLTRGAVNTEVVVTLRGGQTVAAIITNAAATGLRLEAGQRALAIFKASSVILGVA